MSNGFTVLLMAVVSTVAAGGCDLLEPDRELVIATVDTGVDAISLVDTAAVGSVPLSIKTVGSRYCVEVARTDIEVVDDRTVAVTPWNYVRTKGFCDSAPWIHVHEALLDIPTPGLTRVVVYGRAQNGAPTVQERFVVVQ